MSKNWLKDLDRGLILIASLLLIVGLTTVYSTTFGGNSLLFKKQIVWIVLGIIVCCIFYLIPLRTWHGFSVVFYILAIIILFSVLFVGVGPHGIRRWFKLGGLQLQGSEVAKFGFLLFMANFISNKKYNVERMRNLILPLVFAGIPFILVVIEPDIGTSLIFPFLALLLLFYKGVSVLNLFFLLSPLIALVCGVHWIALVVFLIILFAVFYFMKFPLSEFIPIFIINIVAGISFPVVWGHLKPYQHARILSFLFPAKDLQGTGWQILQSKIAIGSGGFWGKGFLHGSQKGFDFLPEAHTDFIFAVISEEFGFIGCIVLIGILLLLLWKGIQIAKSARSDFNSFLAIGIVGIFAFHIMVNLGMTVGVLPVVGVPLPLISYGGSSMIASLALLGLLLNIYRHRYEY